MENGKFVELVATVKNGSFVTIDKVSEHAMKKTGNPLNGRVVMKASTMQVQVGCDLQKIENKRASEEGREPRTIGPLPWGEYVEGGLPLISHKGALYLRGFWVQSLGSEYTIDGKPANAEELATIKQFTAIKPMERLAPLTIKVENITRAVAAGQEIFA
jgi:hypothetical protein